MRKLVKRAKDLKTQLSRIDEEDTREVRRLEAGALRAQVREGERPMDTRDTEGEP